MLADALEHLVRGIVQHPDDSVLRSAAKVQAGDELLIRLTDGRIRVRASG